MSEISFNTVLAVACIAVSAPLLASLGPALRMPAVVVEIVLGIAVGPSGLDWVRVDVPVSILALFGLGFLLFLAGLEIDPRRLRGGIARIAVAFGVSLVIALGAGYGVDLIDPVREPMFVAVVLASTSLGVVVPVLRDAHETETAFGQLVLGAGAVAEFAAILLVSLFFSNRSTSTGSQIVLLVVFAALVAVMGLGLSRVGRSMRVGALLDRFEGGTAQLGVRVAMALLAIVATLTSELGVETILGAFLVGAGLRLVDRDEQLVHERFRVKVEAIGYGFLIPVFFVASGLRFDADALFGAPEHLVLVGALLVAMLVVRALPALLYRPLLGGRRSAAAGLLQATSLTFPVIAAHLGRELHVLDSATAAALVAAGLLSVVCFPPIALRLLSTTPA